MTTSAPLKMTDNRKYLMTNALFRAYVAGWTGDMSDIKRRPYVDSWHDVGGGNVAKACQYFAGFGLVRTLAKGEVSWYFYLTPKGVALAEDLYKKTHEISARDAAADYRRQQVEHRQAIEEKKKRARHLLRGLSLRGLSGKRRALSTMVTEERLGDGFSLSLDLDALLELGEQIENLR